MMIICEFCQTAHVVNTIFCSECGHYLLHDNKPETDPLENNKISHVEDRKDYVLNGSFLHFDVRPVAVRLKIGPGKREVEMSLDKVIHLGRVDPALDVFPEIDLTYESASLKSISRRHAAISKQGDKVIVEDLGSVNGTFVNNKRLDPYLPEALNSGDILQLGKLVIEVEIQKQ